ncbi:hypothetical protein [Rhodospirillaceae bacterium SYSU D60014]|uniref:hypothetical protein n=1 Tax=Virgifigura deserti TaxID=2268457 RepID=UPI0013C50CDF
MPDVPRKRPARLLVWETVSAGYRSVFGDLGAFITRAWLWWVIFVLAIYGLDLGRGMPSFGLNKTFCSIVITLVWVIGSTIFLVSWNRRVLLGEPATSLASLRVGPREERYLGIGILFILVIYASVFAAEEALFWLYGPQFGPEFLWLLDRLAIPVILLAILALGARFSLAFPIVALDGPRHPLVAAWRLSRGQTLRLMGGFLLTIIPLLVMTRVVRFIEYMIDPTMLVPTPEMIVPFMGLTFARIVIYFVQMAVIVSFTCQAYARLTGHSVSQQSVGS